MVRIRRWKVNSALPAIAAAKTFDYNGSLRARLLDTTRGSAIVIPHGRRTASLNPPH
jgi:hypothetical protein